MQSRRASLIESLANIAIGYVVAVGSQIVIFPCFGLHCSMGTNFKIGAWFTLVSLVRSYVLRRWFNGRTEMTKGEHMIETIKISDIEILKRQGYVVFEGGDAAKANSDGFHILIREREGKPMEVAILCPTYLRGPLGIRNGSISY